MHEMIQSIPPFLGRAKNQRYSENGGIGSHVEQIKTLFGSWDLKMSGGIEGEAVNGGAVLGGTTVVAQSVQKSPKCPRRYFIKNQP